MRKKFVFFSFLFMAMFIFGAVQAFAEKEASYDASTMTVAYSDTNMAIRKNGTVYFALYQNNRMISLTTKDVGREDTSVSLSAEVKMTPDSGKVFLFDSELKPMAETVVLKMENGNLVIQDSVTVTKDFEDYNETTGIFEYYADINDTKTSKICVNTENLSVFYNGSLISTNDIIDAFGSLKTLLVERADSITFKEQKNGKFNKVYVTDYAYRQVEGVSLNDLYVKFTIGGFSLNPDDRGDRFFAYNLFDAEGNTISLADVKEGDIFNIAAPMHNGLIGDFDTVPYMDIYVTRETVTGIVDEEIEAGYRYSINGEVYIIDPNANIKVGDEGIFYLTIDKKIYDSDAASILKRNYSFISAYGCETDFGVNKHQLRLFTADGTFLDFTVAATLRVYEGNTYAIYKRSDNGQDAFFAKIASLVEDAATEEEATENLGKRLITYKINSENEITELRFAASGADFSVLSHKSAKYNDDLQIFGSFDLSKNSKLFVAPVTRTNTGLFNVNQDDLRTGSFSSLDANKVGGYKAYLFNFDREDYLGAALVCETVDALVNIPEPEPDPTISKNCSFIANYGSESSFGEIVHQLKLFTESGEFKVYSVAASVRVYNGNSSAIYKRNDKSQNEFFETVADLVADETTFDAAKSKLAQRIITFKTDSSNKITEIRFASEDAIFSVLGNENAKYNEAAQSFGGYDLGQSSKLFVAPVKEVVAGKFNVEGDDLRTGPFTSLDKNKAEGYKAYLFNFDGEIYLGAALVCETVDALADIPGPGPDTEVSKDCSFIEAYGCDTSFGVNIHQLRLFTGDNALEAYAIAPTVKVYEGDTCTSYNRNDKTQDAFFATVADLVADETTLEAAKAKLSRRMITFKVNSVNEITELRFPAADASFSVISNDSAKYDQDLQTFGGYALNDTSRLFVTPVTKFNDACYNVGVENLEIMPFSYLDENAAYSAFLFGNEDDGYLKAALVGEDVERSLKNAHLAIVKSRSTGLDVNGSAVDKYTFIQSGKTVTLAVDYDKANKVERMDTGDVFRYVTNIDGEIIQTDLIYVAKTREFDAGYYTYANYDANDSAIVYGKVTEVRTNKMTIDAEDELTYILNMTPGNTYAMLDEVKLCGSNQFSAVRMLSGTADLRDSYGLSEYYAVAILGETGRFEDVVEILHQ